MNQPLQDNHTLHVTIVVGAASTIAQAIIKQLSDTESAKILAFSRSTSGLVKNSRIEYIATGYTETEICAAAKYVQPYLGIIKRVIICNGILHNQFDTQVDQRLPDSPVKEKKSLGPEKSLAAIQSDNFNRVMNANALVPVMWLQQLSRFLKGPHQCNVVVFSARVGSISDNRSGGWYSYRASKAALNMLLKTTAIEWSRSLKNVKLLSFHPGTTDSPMSKPFQARVAPEKLFSAEFVAGQLIRLLDELALDGELSFADWNHEAVSW